MKFKALFAALLLTSLAGCANQAVVTLQDGSEVLVKDQSDYDKYNDYYEFEQLNGDTILIKKDNVRHSPAVAALISRQACSPERWRFRGRASSSRRFSRYWPK